MGGADSRNPLATEEWVHLELQTELLTVGGADSRNPLATEEWIHLELQTDFVFGFLALKALNHIRLML